MSLPHSGTSWPHASWLASGHSGLPNSDAGLTFTAPVSRGVARHLFVSCFPFNTTLCRGRLNVPRSKYTYRHCHLNACFRTSHPTQCYKGCIFPQRIPQNDMSIGPGETQTGFLRSELQPLDRMTIPLWFFRLFVGFYWHYAYPISPCTDRDLNPLSSIQKSDTLVPEPSC